MTQNRGGINLPGFLREATSHKGELAHLCGDRRDPSERSGDGCAKRRATKELVHLCGDRRDPSERSGDGCAKRRATKELVHLCGDRRDLSERSGGGCAIMMFDFYDIHNCHNMGILIVFFC